MDDYSVVEATGYDPNRESLETTDKQVFLIGDVKKVGNVYTAVKEAYDILALLCQ